MQRAIGQAGSIFTGWISSCLFCLDSSADDERTRHQQAMKQKGAEREMQICHSQPHLVPPMKLVVYDDLPSPGPPPRASSFPTWVMQEGRNLASRASSRASMSFRRKSTAPVRISAPSDFRRVQTFSAPSTAGFRLPELSFQDPANRLPDLPRFSDFHLDEQPPHLARPSKAFSFATEFSYQTRPRTHRPSSSFHLPRKPVGSGSRRSSLATLELLMDKQSPVSHPLIPHFSTRASSLSVATGLATGSHTSPLTGPESTVGSGSAAKHEPSQDAAAASTVLKPQNTTTPLQDKSLPPIPTKDLPPPHGTPSYEPPATPVTSHPPETSTNPSPSRSSRVTQWLLQTTNPDPKTSPPDPRKSSATLTHKFSFRICSRTLSGSTIAPSVTNTHPPKSTSHHKATSTPPSSHTTVTTAAATPARSSTLDAQIEKELDLPISRPYSQRQPQTQTPPSLMSEERAHPTIYEAQQPRQQYEYEGLNFSSYTDYPRHSAIGVAY